MNQQRGQILSELDVGLDPFNLHLDPSPQKKTPNKVWKLGKLLSFLNLN